MKEQSCPNCGGVDPEVIRPGEFRCRFCGTLFHDKELQARYAKDARQQAQIREQLIREQAKFEQAQATKSTGRRVLLFVGILLLVIFSGVFYFAKQAMDQQNQMKEDIMQEQKRLQEELQKNFNQ